MKALIILLSLLTTSTNVLSQNCDCEKELTFVVNYYEENLPGFKDNVSDVNMETYQLFKNDLFDLSRTYCQDEDLCFKTLLVYVEFFKDNHSSIYTNNTVQIDENNSEEVQDFLSSPLYKNRETIENLPLNPRNPIQEIENQYQTKDGTYTVAIVKNKNDFRDYVAVIVDSKTTLWKKGQVKFELKKVGENSYDMFMYMRNHSLQYYKNVQLLDGILNDGWYNIQLENKISYNTKVASRDLTFKEMDTEINYMYIPTFNGNWYAKIAAFYEEHRASIESKPYLIIDVRNNGGGSDACVSPLLKYLYTQPFKSDKVDIYATEENIRKCLEWYEMFKEDTINFSPEFLEEFEDEIAAMKAAPNQSYIPRSTGEMVHLDSVFANPQKIVIIANKNCASSCETLLFWAMDSDKTIIVGENSGGYVGYGEITGVKTPHFNFELGCTMTRYSDQRKYEADGIPPDHYFHNQEDWIDQAVKLLKKR